MGLAYSVVLADAVIAPAFPSNTARGSVLFPVVLSVAESSVSKPDDRWRPARAAEDDRTVPLTVKRLQVRSKDSVTHL